MSTIVHLGSEVLHRYVYELRYEFGQIYWDRAGRVAKQILNDFDEWDFQSIDNQTCFLAHREQNVAFHFGPEKLDLVQTQNADVETLMPVGEFSRLAESATRIVIETLDLQYFSRIGYRVWHLYPTEDRNHSESLIRSLGIFSDQGEWAKLIPDAKELSYRLVTERSTHSLRIAVSSFEQQIRLSPSILRTARTEASRLPKDQREARVDRIRAKKKIDSYPLFGVLLDLDAYLEEPPIPGDLSVSDFIGRAFDDFQEIKPAALASRAK